MRNTGLIHLAEKICDNLDDEDLVKMYGVSKTCQSFIDGDYGRKRLIRKLDLILARKDYCRTKKESSGVPGTLLERYPGWKKICKKMKANASFPALKLFVAKLDEYGELIKKVIDGTVLPDGSRTFPESHPRDPLEMMIRMGDLSAVKLLLTYRLGNFSNAFNYLIRYFHLFFSARQASHPKHTLGTFLFSILYLSLPLQSSQHVLGYVYRSQA